MTHKDFIPLMIFGTLLLLMLVAFIITLLIMTRHRVDHYRLELQESLHMHERDLLKSEIAIQEHVFDWLSRELHDNIVQLLRLAVSQLENARNAPREPERESSLADAEETVRKTLNDLRNLAYKANGERIRKVGLIEAVKGELSYLDSLYRIRHRLDYPEDLPRFNSVKELNIFRIIQEALNNVVRHAKADFVSVEILYDDDIFQLAVRDNGRGWNPQAPGDKGGMGIAGMEKRAQVINGELSIQTAAGKGTCIMLKAKDLQNGRQLY